MLQLTFECPVCHKDHDVTVNQYAFEDWANGAMNVQEAFPNHSPAERELLLTGIDDACYQKSSTE